jgi:hypothetical protein
LPYDAQAVFSRADCGRAEAGRDRVPVAELIRQFKQLQQEENGRLKRLVAELTLDKVMLQDVLAKKCDALAAPPGRELSARHLSGSWLCPITPACPKN